jgi:hypothetical protein
MTYCITLRSRTDAETLGWYDGSNNRWCTDYTRQTLFKKKSDAKLICDELRRLCPRNAKVINIEPEQVGPSLDLEQLHRPLCAGAAGGDAAGGSRATGSPEEDRRSERRADGPHGARDGRAAARVQSGLGVLWGYGAQSGGCRRLPFEPDRQPPAQRLSRTAPPGDPHRIQSHCRNDIVGG